MAPKTGSPPDLRLSRMDCNFQSRDCPAPVQELSALQEEKAYSQQWYSENLMCAAEVILEIGFQPPIPPAVRFERQHYQLWATPSDAQFLHVASGERNRRLWADQSTLAF